MKRLLTTIALLMAFTAAWADSPLTSTHFADAYSDHPMVQMASQEMQYDIPTTLLNFLANKNEPVDVRLAVINKIGWNFDGTTVGAQLEQYLMGRYNVKTEKKLVKKLDAGTLAVFAYARAMSNYFDVTAASALAQQAVKKNKNKSSPGGHRQHHGVHQPVQRVLIAGAGHSPAIHRRAIPADGIEHKKTGSLRGYPLGAW